jgi:hypothetical protein
MNENPVIALLGAEKQAAVSAAQAWPERRFLFVTDQAVADGWDLPSVQFVASSPDCLDQCSARADLSVPLCARWLHPTLPWPTNALRTFHLDRVLSHLHKPFSAVVLPVNDRPPAGIATVVKGNAFHRPDATLISAELDCQDISDPYRCGIAYQQHWPWQRLLLATGRRWDNGAVEMALVRVHAEVCARDDVLGAGETVADAAVAELTLAMLETLDHRGFFTLNWLARNEELRMTSLRPVPRATFGLFRRAGFDPFAPAASGIHIVPPGFKFVVDIHYSSYQRLAS